MADVVRSWLCTVTYCRDTALTVRVPVWLCVVMGLQKDGLYPYQRTQLRPEVPASITIQMMAPLSDIRLTCEVC